MKTNTTNENTAVNFAGGQRIHFGLAVGDLDRSVAFYRTLLQADPVKVKADYAKFESDEPSVNLALNLVETPTGAANAVEHFGIQVKSSEAVAAAAARLKAAGLPVEIEERTTCCYAVQDKVWTADPDGNRWEIFVVTQAEAEVKSSDGECCGQEACC